MEMYFEIRLLPEHVVSVCSARTAAASEKARVALDNARQYCQAKDRPMLDGARCVHDAMARAASGAPLGTPSYGVLVLGKERSKARERKRRELTIKMLRIGDTIAGYRRMGKPRCRAVKNLRKEWLRIAEEIRCQ